ncbi:hypothetical protein MMC28_003849 [Mycoblastus sanguinarius]|nr:hypothetical protein [Mycoblastus sanguinarius]
MESAGLRRRGSDVHPSNRPVGASHSDTGHDRSYPPKYTIDLSLPPAKRYQHVAADFLPQVPTLPAIFDELVNELHPKVSVETIRKFARLFLRRVNSKEETEELRGIQRVTGLEMYLLVAFNVLLDLLMGCTSGGVRIEDKGRNMMMVHFRTLDWGMDALRKIIVHLDFVEKIGGPVIASTVTYVGYVGILTGVRKGLSISLNFRPNHDASSRLSNFRFYFHHLLVLLGIRPSISSLLRQCLIAHSDLGTKLGSKNTTLESIERFLPGVSTTAAYLIFSDGDRTIVLEKDHHTAVVRSAYDFIVATNHDASEDSRDCSQRATEHDSKKTLQMTGMEDIVEDSILRKCAAVSNWEKFLAKAEKPSSRKSGKRRHILTREDIVMWTDAYPTTNEETHFAAIMDPKVGEFIYAKRYLEPFLE